MNKTNRAFLSVFLGHNCHEIYFTGAKRHPHEKRGMKGIKIHLNSCILKS
jgi:hypothetical protein